MKLVWLTDLHLVSYGSKFPHGVDPFLRLKNCLDDIRQKHFDADLLIVSGDLIQLRNQDAYKVLKTMLEDMPIPIRLMVGNHDDRFAFLDTFPMALQSNGYIQGSDIMNGNQIIYLDTLDNDGRHNGQLDKTRLDWLKKTLSLCDCPALIFMHHPPATIGIQALDNLRLNDGDNELHEVLSRFKHRNIQLFCGHVHRSMSGVWRGFSYHTMTTSHVGFALDLLQKKLIPLDEISGYGLIIGQGENLVIHTQIMSKERMNS